VLRFLYISNSTCNICKWCWKVKIWIWLSEKNQKLLHDRTYI